MLGLEKRRQNMTTSLGFDNLAWLTGTVGVNLYKDLHRMAQECDKASKHLSVAMKLRPRHAQQSLFALEGS